MIKRIKIYSTGICPICDKTKSLLSKWNIGYEEVRIDQDHTGLREMAKITNGTGRAISTVHSAARIVALK